MPLYNLVELTNGPWKGVVLRSKEMTESEAAAINAKMSGHVILWMLANKEQRDHQNEDEARARPARVRPMRKARVRAV